MRVLTDEHVSPAVANTLRSEGIDAVTIYDTAAVGKDDPAVLAFAGENESAVLTNDRDYIVGEFVQNIGHGVFSSTRISAPREMTSSGPFTMR